jgi:hypothetical protein
MHFPARDVHDRREVHDQSRKGWRAGGTPPTATGAPPRATPTSTRTRVESTPM